jgi:hypothetical protein
MNYFRAALCIIWLSLLTCSSPNSDRFDCGRLGPLVIADVNMKNGNLNQNYDEIIPGTYGYCSSSVIDTSLPPGLKAIDSMGIAIQGIPTKTGNFEIIIKIQECGTECAGRNTTFKAYLNIL